jgi:hypothetical protein
MPAKRYQLIGCMLGVCTVCRAQEYLPAISVDHPAIQYSQGPLDDPVTRLAKQLQNGTMKLESRGDASGYLASLLEHLGIKIDSQALVFSKTSFQAPTISPSNPRAIYFSDDVAVGYVRGGEGFEVAGTDSKQGAIFYAFNIDKYGAPSLTRRDVCLKCHQGPATLGVPGVFVGSVFPSPLGVPERDGAIITDQRTAFKDRWGGWYVNARRGEQRDRANAVASNPAEPDVLDTDGKQNLTNLIGRFTPGGYLTPVSDIVALMTFEHQTQMTNYFTRVGWEARVIQHDGKPDDPNRLQLDADIEALVTYMLFVDEVPLKEPIEGVSTFTKTFPERGPRDSRGRSLRDFDLQKRLFRYPLSYLIYSAQFDALPDNIRERIYQRLYNILSGQDQATKFANLSADDRRAILEILRDTKPSLPAYWLAKPRSRTMAAVSSSARENRSNIRSISSSLMINGGQNAIVSTSGRMMRP